MKWLLSLSLLALLVTGVAVAGGDSSYKDAPPGGSVDGKAISPSSVTTGTLDVTGAATMSEIDGSEIAPYWHITNKANVLPVLSVCGNERAASAPYGCAVTSGTVGLAGWPAVDCAGAATNAACALLIKNYLVANPVAGATASCADGTCSDAKVYFSKGAGVRRIYAYCTASTGCLDAENEAVAARGYYPPVDSYQVPSSMQFPSGFSIDTTGHSWTYNAGYEPTWIGFYPNCGDSEGFGFDLANTCHSGGTVDVVYGSHDTFRGFGLDQIDLYDTQAAYNLGRRTAKLNGGDAATAPYLIGSQKFGYRWFGHDDYNTLGTRNSVGGEWPPDTGLSRGSAGQVRIDNVPESYFTAVSNTAGAVTVTITVNGEAGVALTSGADFALGSDDTAAQLKVTSDNIADAINANVTLSTYLHASNCLSAAGGCATVNTYIYGAAGNPAGYYNLVLATNQAGRVAVVQSATASLYVASRGVSAAAPAIKICAVGDAICGGLRTDGTNIIVSESGGKQFYMGPSGVFYTNGGQYCDTDGCFTAPGGYRFDVKNTTGTTRMQLTTGQFTDCTQVDLSTATKVTLYTVPAGLTAYVEAVTMESPSAAMDAGAAGTWGFNANADDVIPATIYGASLDAATSYTKAFPASGAKMVRGAAGDVFGWKATVVNGSSKTVYMCVVGHLRTAGAPY